ncbi:MAG: hypothetical protein RI958_888 [Actinomycetota bacterium]|jgi:predicted enzyme related to lactoylglutathione lyase
MIRLRQVALVANDLDDTTAFLCDEYGLSICFVDPGVAEFGLHNALLTIGDQFLEVVAPVRPATTAGRLLEKHRTDVTGYMAIYEVDDLDERMERLEQESVRVVWQIDLPDIRARHLHPADVGGAIISLDQPVPQGSWRWAGSDWHAHRDQRVVTGIAGIGIAAIDPDIRSARWDRLGVRHAVRFHAAHDRAEGIDELDLVAADRSRVGEERRIGTMTIRLV